MVITYLGEIETEQTGNDNLGVRTYDHFHYLYSERSDTAFAIFSDSNTPQTGEAHREDTAARCNGRSVVDRVLVRAPGSGGIYLRWKVKISYSTEITTYENPLLEPAEIWWTGEQYQKMVERNRAGNVITNTSNTPVTGLSMEQTRPIANVRKNIAATGLNLISNGAATDYVNSDVFTIDYQSIGINRAKYKFIGESTVKYRNGVAYRVFDFQLHLREDQWKIYYPNQGMYQVNQDDPTALPWPVIDSTGAQSVSPQPLDVSGVQAPQNSAVITLNQDIYPELNFTTALGPYWS